MILYFVWLNLTVVGPSQPQIFFKQRSLHTDVVALLCLVNHDRDFHTGTTDLKTPKHSL